MAGLAQRGEKNPGPRTGSAQRRRATPLSLVIARYFAYVIVALAFVWVVAFTAFSMTMNAGLVYPANYGPSHDDGVAAAVREAGLVDDGLVPAAYRYVWLDDGSLIATDGDEHGVVAAIDAVEGLGGEGSLAATDEVRSIGRDGTTYSVFALGDGSVCVLTSTYMPQYVTRGLRDALPNPQDLMLVAGCALSVGAVALVARRAARVISRKMAPLTEAAERIAREELDFAVEGSNVREVDDVLSAMERMRASLAESLEARWRSERAAREQVAALAHDLKTPLTVVRANADLLSEEAAEIGAAGEGLAESARAVAEGAAQLDGYVGLLVEASRGEAGEVRSLRTGARDLAARLADSAGRLAAARDVSLAVERDVAEDAVLLADVAAVERAASNLVGNACDHAAGRVTLALREEGGALVVAVGDDGPGFSPAALEHARERLWRDDASRGGARGHYGLGLAIADEVARAHGGSLELSNAPAGGAVATLRLPLA